MDATLPPENWQPYLEALAEKMKQYCYLLTDLTGDGLADVANGDYEQLRLYLRDRGVQAYLDKVPHVTSPN